MLTRKALPTCFTFKDFLKLMSNAFATLLRQPFLACNVRRCHFTCILCERERGSVCLTAADQTLILSHCISVSIVFGKPVTAYSILCYTVYFVRFCNVPVWEFAAHGLPN
jgi:hypothetical protein